VIGFYNTGDRMKIWGKYGAFWGALWGALFGGVFLTLPIIGPVVVVGYLASIVVSAIEGAVVVGGVSALSAALFNAGVPKDHVIHYETALQANGFIVMANGPAEEMARARAILQAHKPARLDLGTLDGPLIARPKDEDPRLLYFRCCRSGAFGQLADLLMLSVGFFSAFHTSPTTAASS